MPKTSPDGPLPERNFYTVEDLMAFFHLERESVINHFAKPGDIPFRKRGKVYLWHKQRFEEWLLNGDDGQSD